MSTQKSILETTLQSILTVIILGDRWGQCTPLTSSLEHGPCYSYKDTMLEIIAVAVTDFMRTVRWGAGGAPALCFPVVVALSVSLPGSVGPQLAFGSPHSPPGAPSHLLLT